MAYDSTALFLQNAAIGRAHSTGGFPYGGNVWYYSSTADSLATVIGTSYFSNGHRKGMRVHDLVLYNNIAGTGLHTLAVTAVSTASGGATAATINSSST